MKTNLTSSWVYKDIPNVGKTWLLYRDEFVIAFISNQGDKFELIFSSLFTVSRSLGFFRSIDRCKDEAERIFGIN